MFLGWSLIIFNIGFFPQSASATLALTATMPAQAELKEALEGNTAFTNVNVDASSININQGTTTGQVATFSGGLTGGIGSTIGIDNGILLVTGNVTTALGANTSFSRTSGGEAGPTDSDLATIDSGGQNDTVALTFQVKPAGNFMSVDFVFASEEYNEFVCSQFNDALGIFVSGPGIIGTANIARVGSNLSPIAVNQINRGSAGSFADGTTCNLGNSAFYVNNVDPTSSEPTTTGAGNEPSNSTTQANYTNAQYDGFTVPLTAQLKVQPGGTYNVKVVIGDIGDSLWDSAVFIDALRSYNLDFGDAPDSYGTAIINQTIPLPGPARHSTGQDIYLGAVTADGENTITPATSSNPANYDDITGIDDEDAFNGDIYIALGATTYSLSNIPAHNGTGKPAKLMGWIDFNKNGTFLDAGEKAEVLVTSGTTSANLSWSGFPATTAGSTYARFRITTDTNITNNPSPLGLAFDGEVEDYRVLFAISNPNVLLVKRITAINGSFTNGGVALNTYDPDPTYPYDKNVIQARLTPPSSINWPNTTGATSSTFLLGARNGGNTQPNDEVEYTIYFLSTGTSPAKNVTLCDRIPRHQAFVPNAFNGFTVAPNTAPVLPIGDRGIEVSQGSTIYGYTNIGDGDAARYYPPGSPLPSACTQTGSTEDNGTVVVNLGDVPNATAPGSPVDSYGFLRFRARVK
jgi:uncharacterized repeat protein (TIGR01451 family)